MMSKVLFCLSILIQVNHMESQLLTLDGTIETPRSTSGQPGPPGPSPSNITLAQSKGFPHPSSLARDRKTFRTVCFSPTSRRPWPSYPAGRRVVCREIHNRFTIPETAGSCRIHWMFVGYKCPYVQCRDDECQGVTSTILSVKKPQCIPSSVLRVPYWIFCLTPDGTLESKVQYLELPQCCNCKI